MPHAKSNPLFFGLMALAGVSAFLIPARFTDRVVPQLQLLFFPVVGAGAGLAAWAHGREEQLPPDDRASYAIRLENDRLRQQNVKLRYDLVEQLKITNELKNLGDLGPLCTPVKVVGDDTGQRESLALAGSSLEGLKDDMCVVYPGGIVGRLQRTGVAGGRCSSSPTPASASPPTSAALTAQGRRQEPRRKGRDRRIRAPEQRARAGRRGRPRADGRAAPEDVGRAGVGPAERGLGGPRRQRSGPPRLSGLRIGRVASITTHRESPLFAEIRIAPDADLLKLPEVMVLTKN